MFALRYQHLNGTFLISCSCSIILVSKITWTMFNEDFSESGIYNYYYESFLPQLENQPSLISDL